MPLLEDCTYLGFFGRSQEACIFSLIFMSHYSGERRGYWQVDICYNTYFNTHEFYKSFLSYISFGSVDLDWTYYILLICWLWYIINKSWYLWLCLRLWVQNQLDGYEEECGAPLISRDQNLTPSVLKYWGPYIARRRKDVGFERKFMMSAIWLGQKWDVSDE